MRCDSVCGAAVASCLLLLLPAGPAAGHVPMTTEPWGPRIERCFLDAEYDEAARLLAAQLLESPSDADLLYNAACAMARLGETGRADAALLQAVQAGFKDFSRIRRDADLRSIRQELRFRALLDARDRADDQLASRRVRQWQALLAGPVYRVERDVDWRLDYLTSLEPAAQERLRSRLQALADHLAQALFERGPTQRVLIALPTNTDAHRLLTDGHVRGVYRHRRRELIATDPGRSLSHEFVHLMHHAHMDRLGQQHPIWIQEGLACLYEAYALGEGGEVRFQANDRTTGAQVLAHAGRLAPWRDLFAASESQFNADAARTYPHVRSIVRFMAEQADLSVWYRTYVAHFDEDPTGALALEQVFGEPLETIEGRWRAWLEAQPITLTGPAVPDATEAAAPAEASSERGE